MHAAPGSGPAEMARIAGFGHPSLDTLGFLPTGDIDLGADCVALDNFGDPAGGKLAVLDTTGTGDRLACGFLDGLLFAGLTPRLPAGAGNPRPDRIRPGRRRCTGPSRRPSQDLLQDLLQAQCHSRAGQP